MKNEDVLAMLVRMGSEFMEYYRLIQSMDSKLERMERILDHFGSLERMEKLLDAFEDQNWYMKDYLTVREVSEYVGLPASRIRRMTEERTLASFRADDRIIIKKDDLIAWINDNHIFSEEELNRKANAIIEETKRRRENRALAQAKSRGRKKAEEAKKGRKGK